MPEPEAIAGSYSIDPAVFADGGEHYLYFGGLWGGQLQKYRDNAYAAAHVEPADDEAALGPRVARLTADMKQFAEAPRAVQILDENGAPLAARDHERRYFEGPWMHQYRGKYYLSYSTGNTHFLCYAVADNPYGPFVYQGKILTPVVGWTTHHSIVEFRGSLVPLLPRLATVRRRDPPAFGQAHGAALRPPRQDRHDRSLRRLRFTSAGTSDIAVGRTNRY